MKSLLFTILVTLVFAMNCFADIVFVPLDEAIKDKDLIIVGTLKDISENSEDYGTVGEGKIVVDQVIAGNVLTKKNKPLGFGEELKLNYVEDFACVMGSHRGIENEKGVFLLTLNDSGEIEYKGFRSLDDLAEIKKLLKKGIKPNKANKKIKVLNFEKPLVKVVLDNQNNNSSVECLYSIKTPKNKEYHPMAAFLVILASVSFYYLLYRSRFKIR